MPVPNSGPLGLYKDIFTEFTQHSQGNNSLHSASIEAGFSTPDAMGDFYGYTDAVAPTMFSQTATSVTDSSMIARGGITSDGGAALTEKGFYFGTNPSSPTSNTKYTVSPATATPFSRPFTGLSSYQNYVYWTFGTNPAGTSFSPGRNTTTQVTQPTTFFGGRLYYNDGEATADERYQWIDQYCGPLTGHPPVGVANGHQRLQWYAPQNGGYNTFAGVGHYGRQGGGSIRCYCNSPACSGMNEHVPGAGRNQWGINGPLNRGRYGGNLSAGGGPRSGTGHSRYNVNTVTADYNTNDTLNFCYHRYSESPNLRRTGNFSDIRLKTNISYL